MPNLKNYNQRRFYYHTIADEFEYLDNIFDVNTRIGIIFEEFLAKIKLDQKDSIQQVIM